LIELKKLCRASDWQSNSDLQVLTQLKDQLSSSQEPAFITEIAFTRDVWKAFVLDRSLEAVFISSLESSKSFAKDRIYLDLLDAGTMHSCKFSQPLAANVLEYLQVHKLSSRNLVKLTAFMKAQSVVNPMIIDAIANRFSKEELDCVDLMRFVLKTYNSMPISYELEDTAKEKLSLVISHLTITEAVDALALFSKSEVRHFMLPHIHLINRLTAVSTASLSPSRQLNLLLCLVKLRRRQLFIDEELLKGLASKVYNCLVVESIRSLEILAKSLSEINFEEGGVYDRLREHAKHIGSESEFLDYLCLTAAPWIQLLRD
jgi:hypothetical protein